MDSGVREEERCLVDSAPCRQKPMILENRAPFIAQSTCDSPAFFTFKSDTAECIVNSMVIVKGAGILVQHLQGSVEARPGLPVDTVEMAGSVHVWSGGVES
ncbi:hypothetical protein CABS01_09827 [Colletotrichum abscissum]|uniref:Uncharacterized protein n=1 Tax=Colletotrichum abscissum TaxID=1671311 RepID=A0A9P9XN53_9PEZI|nr:uncharacterized protein CABS01_09827 [Colletotrichum abscissum]KAI3556889.1 hypothetical protein CABS02_02896 [Colletotrichum abscissum]KAK1501092.1 hypothetical protein CABS01_09827 [Colletotrichum abscissum]